MSSEIKLLERTKVYYCFNSKGVRLKSKIVKIYSVVQRVKLLFVLSIFHTFLFSNILITYLNIKF